jgi:hypothetical protein
MAVLDTSARPTGVDKFLETTAKYLAANPVQSLGLVLAAAYLLAAGAMYDTERNGRRSRRKIQP